MDRKFSIVVPTMWRYDPFVKFLGDLLDHELVGEVIVINNDSSRTPRLPNNTKLRMVDNGGNIKVNPSYNQGVRLARNEDVVIIDDDIIFDLRVFKKVLNINDTNFGVAGLSLDINPNHHDSVKDGIIDIVPWTGFGLFGFGQLLFIKKSHYINIPFQLEIFYGENWIVNNTISNRRNIYAIKNIFHKTPYGSTINEVVSEVYHTNNQTLKNHEKNWFELYAPFLEMSSENAKRLIDVEYNLAKTVPSDINEHVETLYQYALKCDTVTEFGVRTGVSSRAFLKAGKTLKSYDIVQEGKIQELFYAASRVFNARYFGASTLDLEIAPTDMLFIDTDHTYEQLSAELRLHADKVKKYIVFHDTVTYGDQLNPAIFEFLDRSNGEWTMEKHFKNNNGLTIIKRKGVE